MYTAKMTMLRDFSVDLDGDNVEEKIELYTAAERNKKGEMMWDDGQNWVLAVHFSVSKRGEEKIPNITVMVPTGASFSINAYTYNEAGDSFDGTLLYESEDDNWIYSSIPGY